MRRKSRFHALPGDDHNQSPQEAKMSSKKAPTCAACPYDWPQRFCCNAHGKAPANCPSVTCGELGDRALQATRSEENFEFARQASIQEAEGYAGRNLGYAFVRPIKTRMEEIIEFARRMNYKKLGLAFCNGLRKQAAIIDEILKNNGFTVASVTCKVGASPKSAIGLQHDQQLNLTADHETMCNPVLQAEILNNQATEFNVVVGLCVGHDALFFKHAKAMNTVFCVKDRVLANNPIGVIEQYDGYYRCLKKPLV